MPVCLHCGEIGADGALFCGKCGYTLPQEGVAPSSTAPARAAGLPPGPTPVPRLPSIPVAPPPAVPPYAPTVTYATPVGPGASTVGPIPPPANAKYCVRCATLIARAAVYCPVCQQPQP